jgi:hypothetical protein
MPDFDHVAAEFEADRARRAALVAQAQAWTGGQGADEFGTFDTCAPVPGEQLPNIYARLIALSVQRLRVLSGQLARAYAEHDVDALVYERKAYDPGTEELVTVGQAVTALADLEGKERDRLEGLITTAIRLQMEVRSQEAVRDHGRRIAALAQALCEQVGLDWAADDTRRLAQRAIVTAEGQGVRPAR